MLLVADAAWRVVLLFALALAPWGAPVEGSATESVLGAVARLVAFVGFYIAATLGIRKAASKRPGASFVCALTLIAAPLASAFFSGERGPLGRGVVVLGPLVWASVASLAAGPLVDEVNENASRRARAIVGVVVLVLGFAGLVVARPRLSGDALWKGALAADPGNEQAALAAAASAMHAHQTPSALAVLLDCAQARPESCVCAEGAASRALDVGRYPDARRVLEASEEACPQTSSRGGIDAESLVGTPERLDDGVREAAHVLEKAPDDAHAVYARGWAAMLGGHADAAFPDAQRAVALGRGTPAQLLLGLILFQRGDLGAADAQFAHALADDPSSARAAYDHALVADKQQRYHDAREGYLHALSLDPTYADARYNLAILTHGQGALNEAKHHLDELAAKHPDDSRLPWLRQLVATPAPKP